MTLIAIRYRKDHDDLQALADSRASSDMGTLSDHVPKFARLRIRCYKEQKTSATVEKKVLDLECLVGFTGNVSVAFATFNTLQAYLCDLIVPNGMRPPRIADIAEFARYILDKNFREFGDILRNRAATDLIVFGKLPRDTGLEAYRVAAFADDKINSVADRLPLVEEEILCAFGSAGPYFLNRVEEHAKSTGYLHPVNILTAMLEKSERKDIGGNVQIAIANKTGVMLPHFITPRPERGKCQADVTFLGRDVSDIPMIGECKAVRHAVGPTLEELMAIRGEAD